MNALPSPSTPTPSADETLLMHMLRELLSQYVDLADRRIDADTALADIGVDSLTAAELLFALEDRLGVRMGDPADMPRTVGDVIDFALPYLGAPKGERMH